jgi:acyl carrier protein
MKSKQQLATYEVPVGNNLPSKDEVIVILNRILEEDFEIDAALLKPEASLRDDLDLDSLDGVDLIVAIEKEFHFRVDEEEARSIRTLNDIYESIERHLEKL